MGVREVFLSHSSEDSAFVDALAQSLKNHGVPVWISSSNIRGAQEWHDEIGEALRRCDWFAVVLTPSSVKSMWVKREVLYALRQIRFEKRIVPVLRIPCEHDALSWTFENFEFVDFTGSVEVGLRALLRIWGIGFDPKSSAFPFAQLTR